MQDPRVVRLLLAGAVMGVAGVAVRAPAQAEDQIVKLVSVQNAKCLQPTSGSSERGVAIIQRSCNGSVAQQWAIKFVGTNAHLVNRASNLCLDARGKAVNGTPIQQWPCNKISNEIWNFGIKDNLLSSGISGSFSHCVATPGNQDGLPMELRSCDANPSQLWSRPPG